MTEPARCVAIGIYDAKGTLIRRIAIDESGKLAEPLEAIDHRQMVYAMIELENRQVVAVPWMTKAAPAHIANRWAAFTHQEIDSILHGLNADLPSSDGLTRARLIGDTHRELTRRKDAT